jgi:hypothetical protein
MKVILYIPPFHTNLAKLSGRMRTSSSAFLAAMFKNMLKERGQLYDLGWDAYGTGTEYLLTKNFILWPNLKSTNGYHTGPTR